MQNTQKKTGNGQNVGYDMAKMAANSVYQKTGVKPSDVQVIVHINWYDIVVFATPKPLIV